MEMAASQASQMEWLWALGMGAEDGGAGPVLPSMPTAWPELQSIRGRCV
jgi:hypothetical protein